MPRLRSGTVTGDEAVKAEAEWFKAEVYAGRAAKIDIEVKNSLTQFSRRPGNKVTKAI